MTTTPKVLVIDDDEIILNLVASFFRNDNYKVATTHQAKIGLQWALQNPPDVIVLDMMMPEMDGLEVLKVLRNNASTQKIPVLMLTQDDDLTTANRAFESGADAYLIKPFDPALLRQKIAHLISNKV